MSRDWWRRHRIVAPVMAVLLAALGWIVSEPAREVWWAHGPHTPHAPAGDGWTTIGGAGIRLAAFDVAPPIEGEEVPAGYTAWRAVLEMRADGADQRYCDIELEDTDADRYAAGSSYLPPYDDAAFAVECGTGEEPSAVVYFLLPEDAVPNAVWVTAADLLPDYWVLPTGTDAA